MPRHSRKIREQARELFLTSEVTSLAELARRVHAKPHTVSRWKAEEDWDALRLKIDRRAAEQLAERIATERVNLNAQHHKLWSVVVSKLFEALQHKGLKADEVRNLERVAGILERAQKGQRLARGLNTDGQTEEHIRAEFEAEGRSLIDFFIDLVKENVADETVRDAMARAILDRLPMADEAAS